MAPVFSKLSFAAAVLAGLQLVNGQTAGTADAHPKLTTYKCTKSGGCVSQGTSVVIDYNYHWIHSPNGSMPNCVGNNGVDPSLCPDASTCDKNCVIDGQTDYSTLGVETSGDALTLRQYVKSSTGTLNSVSPRVYLLDSSGSQYVQMKLLGQELTFDVDLSTLPCGENGALYFSEMAANGGLKGQAAYGAGYCDAQCPVGTWRNGVLNTSNKGFCCNEMDILEANSKATAFTPHPCNGATDFATDCDKGGCGFNPYAQGNKNYWAPGGTVDTSKKVTITTQFVTDSGTTSGTLVSVVRKYIQNGKVVASAVSGGDKVDSCSSASAFGGLATMGASLGRGMTLVMSIWNDASQYMNWLDSGSNGPCSATEGNPTIIQQNNPGTHVIFSNIRWGDIGSTTGNIGGNPPPVSSSSTTIRTSTTTKGPSSTTSSAPSTQQTHYGQCGGNGYTGPTACQSPYKCTKSNDWYSQCL